MQDFWDVASTKAPDENKLYYVKYTIAFIIFYMLVHLAIHMICIKVNRVYYERDMIKKVDYRTYCLSLFHAPIAVFLSFSSMFLVCEEGSNVFNDKQCFETPKYMHIWTLLNTCAYFLQDLFFYGVVIGDTSALAY